MKRKKSFLKKITLLFVLFFLIHVGHTGVLCKNARDYEEGRKVDLRSKIATSKIL